MVPGFLVKDQEPSAFPFHLSWVEKLSFFVKIFIRESGGIEAMKNVSVQTENAHLYSVHGNSEEKWFSTGSSRLCSRDSADYIE